MTNVYSDTRWAEARDAALTRDGSRCSVSRLFGGQCHPVLHAHHVVPVEECDDPFDVDNLVTACQSHHPMLEAMRRYLSRKQEPRRCPHNHRYPGAREACERRMASAA